MAASSRASLEAFIRKLEQSLGLATKVDDGSTVTAASGTRCDAQNASATELLDSEIHDLEATLRMKVADGVDIPLTNGTASGGKKTRKKPIQHAPTSTSTSRPANARSSVGDQPEGTKVDLRVGQITNVWPHETGDKLYCEEIDVGEGAPRRIASGLVPYYSMEAMKDRRVVVMCNLKARNLKGFKSQGMVMCAAAVLGGGKERVEFIVPPEGVSIGEKLLFEGVPGGPFEPATAAQMEKKKILEKILPDLRADGDGVVRWQQYRLMSSCGPCVAPTVRDGAVR